MGPKTDIQKAKVFCLDDTAFVYRVYQKKYPNYKIASKMGICKITDNQQQPTANIGHQVCISVNFVFICSILLAGGGGVQNA